MAAPPKTREPEATESPTRRGMSRGFAVAVGAAGVILAALPFVGGEYYTGVFTEILIYAIFALSLGFLLGYPRLISLGHAAFFGGGAYAAGLVATRLEIANVLVTLAAAIVFAALLAVVIGLLSLRNTGIYFLMITLALSQLVYVVSVQWQGLTGGSDGLTGIPYPDFFGLFELDRLPFYYFVLALALGAYFFLRAVIGSPFGQALIGIGTNEARMRAIGYDVRSYKLVSFVISGAIAGGAGALWSYHTGLVAPGDLNWTWSATGLIMVIVGGSGTLVGPMLGAALVWFLDTGLGVYTERSTMITGAVFIIFVFFIRGGVVSVFRGIGRRINARSGA
ncbi:branched-chain amino acid ABC transporter permease [Rubrobacter indicoceani]|uniref:branched-chain amino acid ABC transporter permease n=1 Tax=Rubrobacter indicoceani TaxID=2051957 RepID=UPI000E5A7C6E|nr:branched-chain amino acid ABC transporter permease [Rubrobacter indicoceani]